MNSNILIAICAGYGVFLFLIAYYADRAARRGTVRWLRSPIIYTLSLSVYCTAWTFYGAVGTAARSGLEFLAIYIGPSLAFFSWWWLLRRIVRIGKAQNIISIADFISSRYGKSSRLAALVTLVMVVATTPYIALQLQSISQSFGAFFPGIAPLSSFRGVAAISAFALAVFAILFGTRNVLVNERQHGVITAIAVESLVKVLAILAVGIFAVVKLGGVEAVFSDATTEALLAKPIASTRWMALVSLSFMAVLVLPRMFHVLVVENQEEEHLATASWAFPLYLLALNFFVLPIAIVGLNMLGEGSNPDFFVISIPLASGEYWLAYLAFLGGFSAATSMIIMTAIAVSIMVSNHIIIPIWFDTRGSQQSPDDVRRALIRTRRISIVIIMLLGLIYYDLVGDTNSLASIGLIAFIGVAQVFPAMIAGVFWRGATGIGASLGIIIGILVWLYTLFLPSFEGGFILGSKLIHEGPLGIGWLAPYQLFGSNIADPVIHAMFWSLMLNSGAIFLGSILRLPAPLERLQANHFVDVMNTQRTISHLHRAHDHRIEDYILLAQLVLGEVRANALFLKIAEDQSRVGELPIVNDFFLEHFERALGGVLGGAAAHTMVSQIAGSGTVPVSETIQLADETIQNIEYARALEQQSKQLEETAAALQEANATLLSLDAQKDAFLSQISHELRTPMSAIRSFTEILRENPEPPIKERRRMLAIIAAENERLTRLLDEILDLSYLESGQAKMKIEAYDIHKIIESSLGATEPVWKAAGLEIDVGHAKTSAMVNCDFNRLSQVFINLITNAVKYVQAEHPKLEIMVRESGQFWRVEFVDNGRGVAASERKSIFEKFARGGRDDVAGSAGLGLAISREITENFGGKLELVPTMRGAKFRVTLPKTA